MILKHLVIDWSYIIVSFYKLAKEEIKRVN